MHKAESQVGAPLLEACYANLECRVVDTGKLNKYCVFALEVVKAWMAKEYTIQTAEGQNFDVFMALDLNDDGLRNVKGNFFMDEAFRVDEENLEKFELNFPYKEKHIKEDQLK